MVSFEKAIEIFNYRFSPGIIVANDAEIMKYDAEILQTQTLVNIAMNYTNTYHWKNGRDSVQLKEGVKYALIIKGETEPSIIAYCKKYVNQLVFISVSSEIVYYTDEIEAWFELPVYKKPEDPMDMSLFGKLSYNKPLK